MNNFFTPLTVTMLSIAACVLIGSWAARKQLREEMEKTQGQEQV